MGCLNSNHSGHSRKRVSKEKTDSERKCIRCERICDTVYGDDGDMRIKYNRDYCSQECYNLHLDTMQQMENAIRVDGRQLELNAASVNAVSVA